MCDHEKLSDEELLLLIRHGDELARSVLAVRYYSKRQYHGRRAAPSQYHLLDPIDFGALFFHCYLDCENSFRFGSARFQNYFELLLSHQISKECQKLFSGREILRLSASLDSPLRPDEERTTLHDVVADNQAPNDPKIFLNYFETLERIKKLPKGLSPRVLGLVSLHLDGYTYTEAASKMGIPYRSAKTMLSKYRKFVRELQKKASIGKRGNPRG